METGTLVKSIKGHDAERIYVVMAVVSDDFVLVCNGKHRKLDNPKQKRKKHLAVLGDVELPQDLNDAKLRKICK